jgi:hypothetical protein
MKRLLFLAAFCFALGSVVAAQDPPTNWSRMTPDQKRIWLSNCQPPSPKMAAMCEAFGTPMVPKTAPTPATTPRPDAVSFSVVCNDGRRFPLPEFETSGLTAGEVSSINSNNGAKLCVLHDRVLKILADVVRPALKTSTDATAALATSAAGAPSAATQTTESTATATPAAAATTPSAQDAPKTGTACAENGSCEGDISAKTGKPKTVEVKGYTRKDGTYVQGHYRSK